jgi:FkbM family methyltransferase
MDQRITLEGTADGQVLMPSATLGPDGRPRFVMKLAPAFIHHDAGIGYLVQHELFSGGYERITRDVLDAHLQEDDVFIDAGAHWGLLSLSAATALPGRVAALAIEPHPLNVQQLVHSIAWNSLTDAIEIVAAAAGAAAGTARLSFHSTMGHTLREGPAGAAGMRLRVPVVTVDQVLADRPDLDGRRVVMKIDVEGLEPEVLAGARRTIEAGRVALIVWERGEDYRLPERQAEADRATEWLSSLGFRHYALPYPEWGGPLIPLVPDTFMGNVMSFAPGVEKRPLYPQAFAGRPAYNEHFRLERSPERLAEVTRMLIAAQSSDGARWADPAQLLPGAEERAAAAAAFVAAGSRVLDLGAGAMALERALPAGCSYAPADLIARAAECAVVDLNQGQFPAGRHDVAVLLETLEHLHDPAAVLRRCRGAAERLILSYVVAGDGDRAARRRRGFVNDLTAADLEALLGQAGFRVLRRAASGDAVLLGCEAAPDG